MRLPHLGFACALPKFWELFSSFSTKGLKIDYHIVFLARELFLAALRENKSTPPTTKNTDALIFISLEKPVAGAHA